VAKRAILPVLAMASAAFADAPSWTQSPPPPLMERLHPTMVRYRYFVACVATRDWAIAGPVFDTPIGSRDESLILTRVTGGINGTSCSYADRMRMTSMLMRGGIAEARYRHVYARTATIPPANGEIAPVPEGASFEWVGFNRDSPAAALHDFADCLAANETGAVHAVLTTDFAAPAERAAFQALSRRFGTCLRPGLRLRANSLTLRPWLAESQYQLFRARRPDSGS
jgi:hypothetical protein